MSIWYGSGVTIFRPVQPVEFLQNIPLFSLLDHSELKQIQGLTEPFFTAPGERLFEEGESAEGLYVVERGEVEVRIRSDGGREVILAHLGNGSVLGEMALIAGGPRSASVEAFSPTQGYFLSRRAFEQLKADGGAAPFKIILQLARTLDDRRRALENRFVQLKEDPEVRARLREKATRELIARVCKA